MSQDCPQREFPHRAIERTALLHPDRVAASFNALHLTFGELNSTANQLAGWLVQQGLDPGDRVAVCVRPGLEIVVILLAIQKAGLAYLPIDPDYPEARVRKIVDDAQPKLTVSQDEIVARLGSVLPAAIAYGEAIELSRELPADNLGERGQPTDTAYIFYTSGTTGTPKGIAINYRGLSYYVFAAIDRFGFGADDTILSIARYSFSISLFELVTCIAAGGRVILLSRDRVLDYSKLTEAIQQATFAHIGPSLWNGLLSHIESTFDSFDEFSTLRHVSSGGDYVPAELLHRLTKIFSQAEVYVVYGSSEIACMGFNYRFFEGKGLDNRTFIGVPFDGVDIVQLDSEGRPVEAGKVGEICVHGPGVTSGYLNRPELNERAFFQLNGKRFFRTGDLGRLHESGNMEFLGRKDFQIKIRGQRIEILEVESLLRRAPGIRNAIVGTAAVDSFTMQLIGYVTLNDGTTFQPDKVRAYLGEHLPDYMQPSGWVVLDEMPLNENLKIDRSALPTPTPEDLRVFAPYEPPQTATEQALVDIWEDVLDVPKVGIHDDFMNLGGDSLVAMSVCLLAAERGLNLSPLLIESAPTIASLAVKLDEQAAKPSSSQDLNVGPIADFPPFITRFFLERGTLPQRWNISRLLTARKRMSFDWLRGALEQIARKHDALRLRFENGPDGWTASVQDSCDETVLCRLVDLSDVSDAEREGATREALAATQKLVSLSDSPVICMALIEQGVDLPQKLYFVVNHFVMDVVSWRNFWLELDLAYQKLERGESDVVVQAPASFSAWTSTLRSHAESTEVVDAVQRWYRHDWSEVAALPKDFEDDPQVNINSSARVAFASLSVDETQALLRNTSNGLDVERVLFAAFSVALARWQGGRFAYFDRLVHGREVAPAEIDLSRTLGCIVTYAPLLLQVDPDASAIEQLNSVSDQLDDVGNSAGAGVELYRYLGSDEEMKARLKALPRAEILFNYRGRVDDVIERSSLFSQTEEVGGFDHDPNGIRLYPFSFAIDIVQGKLEAKLVYSQNMHSAETVQSLCDEFVQFLRGVLTTTD